LPKLEYEIRNDERWGKSSRLNWSFEASTLRSGYRIRISPTTAVEGDLPAGRQGGEPIVSNGPENKSLLVVFSITILLSKYYSCASSCYRL